MPVNKSGLSLFVCGGDLMSGQFLIALSRMLQCTVFQLLGLFFPRAPSGTPIMNLNVVRWLYRRGDKEKPATGSNTLLFFEEWQVVFDDRHPVGSTGCQSRMAGDQCSMNIFNTY